MNISPQRVKISVANFIQYESCIVDLIEEKKNVFYFSLFLYPDSLAIIQLLGVWLRRVNTDMLLLSKQSCVLWNLTCVQSLFSHYARSPSPPSRL